ncbi:hypothetical protein BXZ70DRAFT_999293 [Cristinia sonorae]|uniref:DUF6570 domain-containing protein n=1 Tax=Cristinia sonorae TaxID=1940300 RepID=A0A8K0USM3_9AGAR|nr:hypothetical protein BXZ70DRAFT_999293 [Cristinia sonorae]
MKRAAERKAQRESQFPPKPPGMDTIAQIVRGYCNDITDTKIQEKGCGVCGLLYNINDLQSLDNCKIDLKNQVTRKERYSVDDPVECIEGPVVDPNCSNICRNCANDIKNNRIPRHSLSNGQWVGDVPNVLKDLSWAEKLLIARVHHNYCVMRFSMSGMKGLQKLRANAISYAVPMPKVYQILPPKMEDLDEVVAFIYIGNTLPTHEDWKRTPFLVRHRKIMDALNWLKLNHIDYADISISAENLSEYPEDEPPVKPDWHKSDVFQNQEAKSVTPHREDEEVETGRCPFIMHTLTGDRLSELEKTDPKQLKTLALKRFKEDGYILGIGHSEKPESIYHNPSLYPQMFPWLFPYGMGGIGNDRMKFNKNLLMYHDKRFQLEPSFSLIAFNHDQIKKSSTGGFLLASKSHFEDIANRLLNIKDEVLAHIIKHYETEQEKQCYQLLRDIDFVNGKIEGSITSKKYMRNEIWSLMSYLDVEHPIALYYADTQETKPCSRRTILQVDG